MNHETSIVIDEIVVAEHANILVKIRQTSPCQDSSNSQVVSWTTEEWSMYLLKRNRSALISYDSFVDDGTFAPANE